MKFIETKNEEEAVFFDDGTAEVTKMSAFSNTLHTAVIVASPQQFREWMFGGKLIQNAFPHLSADEREFIMTGITPEEWCKTFGNGEE